MKTSLWLLSVALILSPVSKAGTNEQKNALSEYRAQTNPYSSIFSYYSPITKEITENIYDDEVALGNVHELYLALISDEDFPINVIPDVRQKLDSSLAHIESLYPESKRKELYSKLECSASGATLADLINLNFTNLKCGLGNFEKLSGATLFELTVNTLSLAPLTAIDFVSPGTGSATKP